MSFTEALFGLMPMQALACALVLITLIGWRGASLGGRWAQGGLVLIALGLAMLSPLAGGRFGAPHYVHTLGLAAVSAGLSAVWWALGLWLQPRAGRRIMAAAPVVMGLGHALMGADRVAAQEMADLVLAAQLAWLGVLLARPGRTSVLQGLNSKRWRLLGLLAVVPVLVSLCWRVAAGMLELHTLLSPDLLLALTSQLALLLTLPMLLLAWRAETEAELARLAQTDGLTGLIDRPAFDKRSTGLISTARRHDEPLALVAMELDDFAALADEHGAEVGDKALALFASCVQSQMRLCDIAGRLAGDQFGVLMARSEHQGPEALDARLRKTLGERAPAELGFPLSFSAGWAKLRPGDRGLADLQRRAETALYEAKRAGRGRLLAEPGVAD